MRAYPYDTWEYYEKWNIKDYFMDLASTIVQVKPLDLASSETCGNGFYGGADGKKVLTAFLLPTR